MNSPIDIAKERTPLNNAQIVGLIIFVASIAWTLAGIYFEFKTHETEMNVLRERVNYVNERIDKKFSPLSEQIKELENYHKK